MYDNDIDLINKYENIKLADDIYVIKNFANIDIVDAIFEKIKTVDKKNWHGDDTKNLVYLKQNYSDSDDDLKNYYLEIKNSIDKLFQKKYQIFGPGNVAKLSNGCECELHADSDSVETDFNWPWTCVLYINDNFDGGEIYYPKKLVSYKPQKNDLIIHRPDEDHIHGVKPVYDGIRCTLSTFVRNFGWKQS